MAHRGRVGWVERSDTHHLRYGHGFRFVPPILRTFAPRIRQYRRHQPNVVMFRSINLFGQNGNLTVTTDEVKPFFSVDLSNGEHLSFADMDEINNWIATEEATFQFLIRGGGAAQANQLREEYSSGLQNLRQYFQSWRNNPNDNEVRQTLANVIQGMYSSTRIVLSGHPFARIASDIASSDGDIAASAALASLLGKQYAVNSETIKGVIRVALVKYGVDPKSPDIVVKALADLSQVDAQDRKKREAAFSSL